MNITDAEWAHNTEHSGPNRDVPVLTPQSNIEPDDMANWHPATPQEIEAYEAYWADDRNHH